jgi:glycosyltransferase involved in cell wall biosynthesis
MTRASRVLIVTETFHPEVGGGETQARTMADAFMTRGYDVVIVTRRSRTDLPHIASSGQLQVIRVGPRGPGRWKKWGMLASAIPAIASAARDADAVLVSGFRILGVPAILASRLHGAPCILKGDSRGEMSGEFFRAGVATMGLTPRSFPVRAFVGLRNMVLRRAARFVAISSEMRGEFLANGVPPDRVTVIPNGIDVAHFRPAGPGERRALRRELGWPDGFVAVYTGRLVTYKGLPLLLRTLASMQRDGDAGTLVLVGTGGSDMHACEHELRAFVREQGLEQQVRFTGTVPDVASCLRAADLFVFPTLDEAFGLSLVEAMACGLPVVSTAVGGIRDFLSNGVNGIEVAPDDGDALRRAIQRLMTDPAERDRLGQCARDTAVSRFSDLAVADAWIGLFESMARRSAPRGAP